MKRGGGGGGGGESGSGWGSGLSDEKNVVWRGSRGSRRSRTGGAQSDEMKRGEMKSLKKDEEEERAEHT